MGLTVTGQVWTIPEACAEFERAGTPVDEARFRLAVTRVARLKRAGETRQPPGSKGGRGCVLYPAEELRLLHAALARWLTVPGDTRHPALDNSTPPAVHSETGSRFATRHPARRDTPL